MQRSLTELKALARLGFPIVIAQTAQSTMTIVDTLLIAPLGSDAIGAVGLGGNFFFGIVFTLAAVLLCLDALISQALGRRDADDADKIYTQSLVLSAVITPIAVALLWLALSQLDTFSVKASIVPLVREYVLPTYFGVPALVFGFGATKYLQAQGKANSVMVVAIAANVANYLLDLGLIHGRWGLPRLGVGGAGLATALCRWFMLLCYLVVIWRGGYTLRWRGLRIDWKKQRQMLRLGVPAALQVALELSVFMIAGFLIARFDSSQLAAHYILLQTVSATFMVPLGISAAGSVRVGHAVGAGQLRDAAFRGDIAILSSFIFMCASAAVLVLLGEHLPLAFGADAGAIAAFSGLLGAAIVFQVFDGVQVSATGVLRGLGDTRTAFFANLFGHWVIAFPLGLWLAFTRDLQSRGVWFGLMTGLIVVAFIVSFFWVKRSRAGAPHLAAKAVLPS